MGCMLAATASLVTCVGTWGRRCRNPSGFSPAPGARARPSHRGRNSSSLSPTRLRPDPPSGRPVGSSRVRRPSVHTLLDRVDGPCSPPCTNRRGTALDRFLAQRSGVTARTLRMQPAKPARPDPALVLTPAGSSPPILREIRRFPPSSCLPRATRGYPRQRRGDAGIAAGAGSGPSALSTQADPSRPWLSLELELVGFRALAPPAAAAQWGTRLSMAVGRGAVRRGQGVRELGAACGRDPRNSDSMRARRQRCAGRPQSDERRTPSDGENPPAGACGVLMGYAY